MNNWNLDMVYSNWKKFLKFSSSTGNSLKFSHKLPQVYCLLFIVLFAKNFTNQIKSNYLNSHGEEAQEKPPGL